MIESSRLMDLDSLFRRKSATSVLKTKARLYYKDMDKGRQCRIVHVQ